LGAAPAWAAGGEWRPVYDTVMMWINSAILFGIIYKFGRKPLMAFLRGQGDEVAKELQDVEDRRLAVARELADLKQMMEARDSQLADLKARMAEEGELSRKRIIEQAQAEAQRLLEEAGQRTGHQIEVARHQFRADLVDLAIRLATERLPSVITPEDSQRLVGEYIQDALPSA